MCTSLSNWYRVGKPKKAFARTTYYTWLYYILYAYNRQICVVFRLSVNFILSLFFNFFSDYDCDYLRVFKTQKKCFNANGTWAEGTMCERSVRTYSTHTLIILYCNQYRFSFSVNEYVNREYFFVWLVVCVPCLFFSWISRWNKIRGVTTIYQEINKQTF